MKALSADYTHQSTIGAGLSGHIFLKTVDEFANRRDKGGVDTFVEVFFLIANKYGYCKRGEFLVAVKVFDKADDFGVI